MTTKELKELETSELSQAKAEALEVLVKIRQQTGVATEALKTNKDDTNAKELLAHSKEQAKEAGAVLDAINKELEERGHSEGDEKLVKVKAKNWVPVDGKHFQKDQEGKITTKQYKALACHFERLAAVAIIGMALLIGGVAKAQQITITPLTTTNATWNNPTNLLNGNINCKIASTVSSNFFISIPQVGVYGDIGLTWSYMLDAAGTTASILHMDGTYDGTNYFNWGDLSLAGAGNTRVTTGTNTTLNSLYALRCSYITNASAAGMTGIVVSVTVKPRRLGN